MDESPHSPVSASTGGLAGPDGPRPAYPSARPGDALTVLREKLLALTYACPRGCYVPECPFAKFTGVSHPSREGVFARLSEGELTRLFDLSPSCACPADPRKNPAAGARYAEGFTSPTRTPGALR